MARPPKSELTDTGQYTPELIEHALTIYATTGNAREAERQIKAEYGKGPTQMTILNWSKDSYNAVYLRIREGLAEQIKSKVAARVEDLLQRSLDVQEKALTKAEGDLEKLDPRDSAGALRNIATSAGILATNLREMRPKDPIKVEVEHNADDLMRKLGNLLGGGHALTIQDSHELTIQGSAEEIVE